MGEHYGVNEGNANICVLHCCFTYVVFGREISRVYVDIQKEIDLSHKLT